MYLGETLSKISLEYSNVFCMMLYEKYVKSSSTNVEETLARDIRRL